MFTNSWTQNLESKIWIVNWKVNTFLDKRISKFKNAFSQIILALNNLKAAIVRYEQGVHIEL